MGEDYADDECGAIELDEPYFFGAMRTQNWSLASRMSVTPRKMWNFADWGVRYDHGTFLRNSELRNSRGCDIRNVAQSEYFVRANKLEDEDEVELEAEEELNEQIHVAHEGSALSAQSKMILLSSAAIFGSAALLFMCAFYLLRSTKKLDHRYDLLSGSNTDIYGSVEQYKL